MANIKYSRQRASILEFLKTRKDHPTADTVYDHVRLTCPNISLGTVYRNLSLLSSLGEIRKLESFGSADRFDARTDPHCHFMCTVCGKVLDMDAERYDKLLSEAAAAFEGGRITDYDASFFGICKDCQPEQ